jgi:hypothetical protein
MRESQSTQASSWSLIVLAMIQSLWPPPLTIVDEPESAALAIGLCVLLSVLSLALLPYFACCEMDRAPAGCHAQLAESENRS